MSFEQRLQELGHEIPEVVKPLAAYVPAVRSGNMIYTAGQIPMVKGELKYCGQVGSDLSLEEGYEAARICALNALAAIRDLVGTLDQVEQIVKVVGFVNCRPGYEDHPKVINGASELLGDIFGDQGKHARSAVGANGLPLGSAVEVEMVVRVREG